MTIDTSDLRHPEPGEVAVESWVFVSHTADDESFLRAELEPLAHERHLQLHLINRRHPPTIADAYRKEILRSLIRCGWFLAALTPRSILSPWVKFEVSWALENKPPNRLLLVLFEECDTAVLDARLPRLHPVNCSGLDRWGIRRFCSQRRLRRIMPRSIL
jgi:hypothetical protein